MEKAYFLVCMDTLENAVNNLDDAELGELLRAIYAYHKNESFEFQSKTAKLVFSFFEKNFKFNKEKHEKICKARKDAINKRWHKDNQDKSPDEEEPLETLKEEEPKEVAPHITKDKTNEIKDMWNEMCGATFGKIQTITVVRGQKLKTRIKDFGDDYLDRFREIFERLNNAPFCLSGAKKWCNFDWIIANDNNYVKLLEGRYDHEPDRPLTKFELSKLNDQQLGSAIAESCVKDFEEERRQDKFVPPKL